MKLVGRKLTIYMALLVFCAFTVFAIQGMNMHRKGVVKIISSSEGKTEQGTGFIVCAVQKRRLIYIITSSHVVEFEEPQIKIIFPARPNEPFNAKFIKQTLDKHRGLSLVLVEADTDLINNVAQVDLATEPVIYGEDIIVIGFPQRVTTITTVNGSVNAQEGEFITFSGNVHGGFSGSPVMRKKDNKVIGLVTHKKAEGFGLAVPANTVNNFLKGCELPDECAGKCVRTVGNLMWQACKVKSMRWDGVIKFVESCKKDSFLGYNDWRLPAVAELQVLKQNIKKYPDVFFGVNHDIKWQWYWSAEEDLLTVWCVNFGYGKLNGRAFKELDKDRFAVVRVVRNQ